MPDQRVILFVDAQNTYRGARRAFFGATDPHLAGQFDPIKLGKLICARNTGGEPRTLAEVRVYTGRPEAGKQPRTYGAHRKQCAAWEAAGVKVIARTLRYPRNWPTERAEEKGIDVALAIDYVTLAMDRAYDIGVIASTDTDLRPALEVVCTRFADSCRAEVMAWNGPYKSSRLAVTGKPIWCHWLTRADYDSVADPRDYNL